MAEHTVAAGFARGLMQLAVAKGANQPELTRQSGLDPAQLDDPDARIPFASYVALMRAGQALCGDPALALHYGETMDLSQISVVGLIGQASATMQEAFAQINRYSRLVVEFDGPPDRFQMSIRPDGLWMTDTRRNPDAFPELTESTFARFICGPRRFGVTQLARAVHVTHAAPIYRDEYLRIFGAPVTFGSDRNAICIDEAWMLHRIQLQPRYVFGVLSKHADGLLTELKTARSARSRVEAILLPVLHTSDASMKTVARELGTSRQTLFRRLKNEGVTFEQILNDLRHRLALHYLNGTNVSVNETAYLLGFSDPAAFSRAFKRWTGESPRAFRGSSTERR